MLFDWHLLWFIIHKWSNSPKSQRWVIHECVFPWMSWQEPGKKWKWLIWWQDDSYPRRNAQGWSWDSALTLVTAPVTCPQGCSVGHQVTAWHFDFVILPYPFPSFLLHAWMVTISDNDVTLEMELKHLRMTLQKDEKIPSPGHCAATILAP